MNLIRFIRDMLKPAHSEKQRAASLTLGGIGLVLGIEFAAPEQIRARRVISRSRHGHTGKFPSWKVQRMVHWESVHELNAFRLLDCDPAVIRYSEQPCIIQYSHNGETRMHYPDIMVERTSGKELWEIKPDSASTDSEVVFRSELMVRCLPSRGFVYRVLYASELSAEPMLDNASVVLRHGRWPLSDLERELARRALRAGEAVTWEGATELFGKRGRIILCRLVLEGELNFDRSMPIKLGTVFYRKG